MDFNQKANKTIFFGATIAVTLYLDLEIWHDVHVCACNIDCLMTVISQALFTSQQNYWYLKNFTVDGAAPHCISIP